MNDNAILSVGVDAENKWFYIFVSLDFVYTKVSAGRNEYILLHKYFPT